MRPKLALPDSGLVFPEATRLRWHPSAAAFHTLHNEGKLSVLPAVGYTDADQSHFTSRHYWEVGDTKPGSRPAGSAATSIASEARQPTAGREAGRRPLAVAGDRKKPVAALSGASNYSFWAPGVWGQVEERMLDAVGSLGASRGKDPALAGARAVTFQSPSPATADGPVRQRRRGPGAVSEE